MTYQIVSPRVGTPGEEYIPRPGVDVAVLIAIGAIIEVEASTPKPTKSAKTKSKNLKE
jgi:hypothetical protein